MASPSLNRQIVNSNGVNNMTGVAVVVSDYVNTEKVNAVNLEIRASGTGAGTLTCEGTNQKNPANFNEPMPGITWVTLPAAAMNPPLPAVAGANVDYDGDLTMGVKFVRWRYTNSSGAGQLNMFVNSTGA